MQTNCRRPQRRPVVYHVPINAPPMLTPQQIGQIKADVAEAVRQRDIALERARQAECQNQRLSELERASKRRADAATLRQLEARRELEKRETILRSFQSKYDKLKHQQNQAAQQAKQQFHNIQRNNAELRARNATLCNMIQERQRDAAECARLRAQLQASNANLQQLQEVQLRLNEARGDVKELQEELRDASKAVKESNRARAAAQAEVQELREQQKTYQSLLLACVGIITEQRAKIETLTGAVKSREAQIKQLQKEADAAQKRMEKLKCQNVSVDRLNAELLAERDASKRQLCQERLDAARAYGALQFALASKKADMQNLEQRYEELQASARAEAEELKASNAELAASIAASREQAAASAAALEALAGENDAELDALRQEKQSAEAELDRAAAETVERTRELATAEAERDEYERLATILVGVLAAVVVGVFGAVLGFFLTSSNGDRAEMPEFDPAQYKVVVENERWFPITGWSKSLLPTDRYPYTELDGSTQSAPPGDEYRLLSDEAWKAGEGWRVEKLGSDDGWLYAVDFPRAHYTERFSSACVRRRVHVREYVVVEAKAAEVAATRSMLMVGEILRPDDVLISNSGEYRFVHQGDGNLVLYDRVKALWSSKTSGKSTAKLDLQTDGNLVLYDAKGKAHWSSKTSGKPAAFLEVQDDGNVVLYTGEGRALWSTR